MTTDARCDTRVASIADGGVARHARRGVYGTGWLANFHIGGEWFHLMPGVRAAMETVIADNPQ